MSEHAKIDVEGVVEMISDQVGLLLDELNMKRATAIVLARATGLDRQEHTLVALSNEAARQLDIARAENVDMQALIGLVSNDEISDEYIKQWDATHAEALKSGAKANRLRFHAHRILRTARVVAGLYASLSKGSEAMMRADKAEAEARHAQQKLVEAQAEAKALGQKLVEADATIQRLKGHLALLNHTPDGKPYPAVTPLPVPELPAYWVKASDGFSASVHDEPGGVGRMAMEQVGDRIRVLFTYDLVGESFAAALVARLAIRVAAVGQLTAPEGIVFGAPDGSPMVRLSPGVARLLGDQIRVWRQTLPADEQEWRIAKALGLMKPGESMADARGRIGADCPSLSKAT